MSTIIPVQKKPNPKQLNDYRPIALTSILCKYMEGIIRKHLLSDIVDKLDPFQFAYKSQRGVDDASITLFNLISKHLETKSAYVRILFIDFSSAFNTIEPFILLKRLISMNVNTSLILWISDFLRDRPQRVCVNSYMSDEIVLNVGAPQGCVLSPTLFSIYTDHMRCNTVVTCLFKFADDMALVGLLKNEDSLAEYFHNIQILNNWCSESFLHMNITKTKELVVGHNTCSNLTPVTINDDSVEVVSYFKYLGSIIDAKLTFSENTDYIARKAQQRLYLLRKLKSFNVSQNVLQMVYRSLIESILTFNIVLWYGNLSVKQRSKLSRIVSMAEKVIGCRQVSLSNLYQMAVARKARNIINDSKHPLHSHFEKLPSGRRYRVPIARKNLFKKSFLPTAVTILNSNSI